MKTTVHSPARLAACLTGLTLLVAVAADAQQRQVPSSYQDLNTLMNQQLGAFNQTLDALGASSRNPEYAANLVNADANIGPQLVRSAYHGELQELQAMGVKAVMVHVGFPMLYEPFFSSQPVYQQYVDFYKGVANSIHSLGMRVIVENDTLPSAAGQNPWNPGPFYATLNWTQYQQARAAAAAVVAQTMQPDYMVAVEEPDTEAAHTGQTQVNTPAGGALLLSGILKSLSQAGVTGMRVGAGVGSWQPSGDEYIKQFAALPLDTIDIHIYVVNRNNLPDALKLAQTANTAGKPVSISECWLNKVRNSELGVLTPLQVEARDAYGFWAPVDAYFLRTLQNFAAHIDTEFISIFESHYFWAYLNYDSIRNSTPPEVLSRESRAAGKANQRAEYTSSGTSYYNICVAAPDKSAPSVPAGVSGKSGHPGSAAIKWKASTDNVGVAGYYVQRSGVRIAATSATNYTDTGLTSGQTYTFNVRAFDLAGNVSNASKPVQVVAQ